MGTHPIFESDFDCLTECHRSDLVLRVRLKIPSLALGIPLINPTRDPLMDQIKIKHLHSLVQAIAATTVILRIWGRAPAFPVVRIRLNREGIVTLDSRLCNNNHPTKRLLTSNNNHNNNTNPNSNNNIIHNSINNINRLIHIKISNSIPHKVLVHMEQMEANMDNRVRFPLAGRRIKVLTELEFLEIMQINWHQAEWQYQTNLPRPESQKYLKLKIGV